VKEGSVPAESQEVCRHKTKRGPSNK